MTRVLEELGGESLRACRKYYQGECLDPFLAIERALAGEVADDKVDPAAISLKAEGDAA
jgi:hypothetical protein